MTDDGRLDLSYGQLVALTAVMLLAFAASLGMPFNLDAIVVSFSTDGTGAGLVASGEMATIAAGTLAFARITPRLDPHRVYWVGVLTIVVLNVASIGASAVTWLGLLRLPAGFALGAVVATVTATAGRSRNPEMTFGVINSMVGVMGMIMSFVLPRALSLHEVLPAGYSWSPLDGLYIVYVLCSLAALAFIGATPVPKRASVRADGGRPPPLTGWLALCGIGFLFVGQGILGVFLVKIGRSLGMAPESVGYVFMAGSLLTVAAPMVTGYLGSRIASILPTVVLGVLVSACAVMIATADSPTIFYVAAPVFVALPMAIMPIVVGGLSRFDPTGGLTGAHPAFLMTGGAVAPFAGGFLSDVGGFPANGWAAVVCFVVSVAAVMPMLAAADRLRGRPVRGLPAATDPQPAAVEPPTR